MKLLVTHDAKGNISAAVTQPDKAPPGAVATRPGEFLTLVDAPEAVDDLSDPKSHVRLVEALKNYRIDARTDGKLVKRPPSKT